MATLCDISVHHISCTAKLVAADLGLLLLTPDRSRLLQHLRVKLEESSLAEVMVVVDPDGLGSFSLQGLLEVALSMVEDKKVQEASYLLASGSLLCILIYDADSFRERLSRVRSRFSNQ